MKRSLTFWLFLAVAVLVTLLVTGPGVGGSAMGDGTASGDDTTVVPEVSAGGWHTVGLKSDGTVVAVGDNTYGQCEVGTWSVIQQVSAGICHTVGLKSDGTVVAVGDNIYGQCNVTGWSGIQQVSAGKYHTVGLKSDGTVVAVGDNYYGQCEVSSWCLFIDGEVNVLDLPVEKQIIIGELPLTCGADANQDSEINILDLVKIKKIIIGP